MIKPEPQSVCVPARFAALPDLLASLDTQGLAPEGVATVLRARLAVEELFTNTIQHGYGHESDSPVWLTVQGSAETLRVVYSDAADAFDPLHSTPPRNDLGGVEVGHEIGGLGRLLVMGLARHCSYTRESGRNVTLLEFAFALNPVLSSPPQAHPRQS
jgi:anti-sigma regulatory factor (Ser/Thr protein kinase)